MVTRPFISRSRRRKYQHFWNSFRPTETTTVLDIGLANKDAWLSNFLEAWYPWPRQIIGVSLYELDVCQRLYPDVRLVRADGLCLPFRDKAFDVAFANAVIEHVGSRARQRLLIEEMLRVARQVFITTPDRYFPIDPHTLTPFFHWLPVRQRSTVYRRLGFDMWAAGEEILNPLSARDLVEMFPPHVNPIVHRSRVLGLSANLTVVARPAAEPSLSSSS